MAVRAIIAFIALIFSAGCTTTRQPSEINQLQIKVSQLERKLDDKDQEISDLKDQIADLSGRVDTSDGAMHADLPEESAPKVSLSKNTTVSPEDIIRVSASAKEIQRALKKAGYYEGTVDGKLGAKSQKSITNFQKDHGLGNDGIVGQKTWSELKKYLE